MTETTLHDRVGERAEVRAAPMSRRVPVHVVVLGAWHLGLPEREEAILLGLAGAVLGALVSGVFDHYWFNLT